MNAYRCAQQGNRVNPYTVSILNNGKIEPLKSSLNSVLVNENALTTQQIVIGNNVRDCVGLFYGCHYLNTNVVIPNGVESCHSMFRDCYRLNQNIQIPESVTNCGWMFFNVSSLGYEIKIPNNATDCSHMFYNIRYKNFSNIHIPSKVTSVDNICGGGDAGSFNYAPNIYFEAKDWININIQGMFGGGYLNGPERFNANFRKNVFFNSILNNIFNRDDYHSIADRNVTWTPMTNGFYNAEYNFYMYNNY